MAMNKIDFENEVTSVSAETFNEFQNNIDAMFTGKNTMEKIFVEDIECKNIFDGLLEVGGLNTDGSKNNTITNNYRSVNMVAVEPNTTYIMSIDGVAQQYVMFFFDADKNFIQRYDNRDGTFTTTENCHYVNFRCYQADFTSDYANLKVQIEKGDVVSNYVKHKEFGNSGSASGGNNNVYSTEERIVGTWIDGKPLYRKVVTQNISDTTSHKYNLSDYGITNIDTIFAERAFVKANSGETKTLPSYETSTNYSILTLTNTQVTCQSASQWFQGAWYIILNYTKTTDTATIDINPVNTMSLEEE